jgi:hypothetical protein
VKRLPLFLAALALSFGAGPARAVNTLEGCDIVAFAGKTAPVAFSPAPWRAYREAAGAALASDEPLALSAPDTTLTALAAAQADLLETVKDSPAYRDYLAGGSCRVIAKLDASAVAALLAEAVAASPAPVGRALAEVVAALESRIDAIRQTARFRSPEDLASYAARYYCFIAASIVTFLPPERRAEIALEDFGDTMSCHDAGRA